MNLPCGLDVAQELRRFGWSRVFFVVDVSQVQIHVDIVRESLVPYLYTKGEEKSRKGGTNGLREEDRIR